MTNSSAYAISSPSVRIAGEAVRVLRETFSRAYAAHAEFVAQINKPAAH